MREGATKENKSEDLPIAQLFQNFRGKGDEVGIHFIVVLLHSVRFDDYY